MTATPSISCIVPVFNSARYIAQALDSIFRQTRPAAQVIVVDDGSTDGASKVVAGYGQRLRYVYQPNAGPAAARNHGLRLAEGEFIAFLDADDHWHEEKLALQMARFDERPELELCITHVENFWEPEVRDEEERVRAEGHRLTRPVPGYVCQTVLARRGVFDKVGAFDESLRIGEDNDWFSRAHGQGIVTEVLADVLVYRRLHGLNISRQLYTPEGKEFSLKMVMAALQRRRARQQA